MTLINLNDVRKTLDDALDAKQAHRGEAGGTVTIWAEAPDGTIICVSDGDADGHPFCPNSDGEVDVTSFFIGRYPSYDSLMDGDMFDAEVTIAADLDVLAQTVRDMTGLND